MNRLSLLLCTAFFISCATTTPIALKGAYSDQARNVKTLKSFDEVLTNLSFAMKSHGIAIKHANKESGEIITEATKIPFTTEDSKGQLKNPQAYIVCVQQYSKGSQKKVAIFGDVTAEWQINILKDGDSNTVYIKPVHLANFYRDGLKTVQKAMPAYHTTGVFETMILSKI